MLLCYRDSLGMNDCREGDIDEASKGDSKQFPKGNLIEKIFALFNNRILVSIQTKL